MNTILLSEDLPTGGARRLFRSNYGYLKNKFDIITINDKENTSKITNIFSYYFYIICILLRTNAKKYYDHNKDIKLMLAYQNWVTKSPLIMKTLNIPVVYICHEPPREFYDEEYIKTFSVKEKLINRIGLIIKNIDKKNIIHTKNLRIIANSYFSAKKIFEAYGIISEVVYPGISLSKFSENIILENRKNQIISVGSINKLKNQKYLVECISKIDKKIRPRLILVGNGGDSNYIKRLEQCAKIWCVDLKIYLNISDNRLNNLYRHSKLFIYSPINEPFGIVVLEALAAGLPIVSSSIGGFSEILSNENGYLLSSRNRQEWARIMNQLLTDKVLWKNISHNNYRYSRKFSDLIMNKKIQNILNASIADEKSL